MAIRLRKLAPPLAAAVLAALAIASVAGANHDGIVRTIHANTCADAQTCVAVGNTTGIALAGTSTSSNGIFGSSDTGAGLSGSHLAETGTAAGVEGATSSAADAAAGVRGRVIAAAGLEAAGVYGLVFSGSALSYGVWGDHGGSGPGVNGSSSEGPGVRGTSIVAGQPGVVGRHNATTGAAPGVEGRTSSGAADAAGVLGAVLPTISAAAGSAGVRGRHDGSGALGHGVLGVHSDAGSGVRGEAPWGVGVEGVHLMSDGTDPGVRGSTSSEADLAAGVYGEAPAGSLTAGVYGSSSGFGVLGIGAAAGVLGYNPAGLAGYFIGNVAVTGTLTKGAGAFRIDHPLEPETKYLQHSFVESPDMKNVYDGVVHTDRRGFATVRLPRYFGALNRDFRYQLTILGKAGWDVEARVWDEIDHNRFTIRTNRPGIRVSWQVTGIRKDRYANANRIQVEITKTAADQRTTALGPRLARARR